MESKVPTSLPNSAPSKELLNLELPDDIKAIVSANKMELSYRQKECLHLIFEEKKSIFATGGAGTGKSALIKIIKQVADKRRINCAVTGTTGIASVSIGGKTIHSFSSLGIGDKPLDDYIKRANRFAAISKRIRSVKILIIDECSMLDDNYFQLLNMFFKSVRGSSNPMGGVQVVLCGDFFQLPPHSKDGNPRYVFNNLLWHDIVNECVILETVFRQKDKVFIEMLNRIRVGIKDPADMELLKSLEKNEAKLKGVNMVKIFATRNEEIADNTKSYELLKQKEQIYTAKVKNSPGCPSFLIDQIFSENGIEKQLKLKCGCQVMVTVNDTNKGIANGMIGIIDRFELSGKTLLPVVKFSNGSTIIINPNTWDKESDTGREKAEVSQIPLKIAYSFTIHKSQGQTYPVLYIDASKIFEVSQAYVALSRAVKLEHTVLKGFTPDCIRVSVSVHSFYESAQKFQDIRDEGRLQELKFKDKQLITQMIFIEEEKKQLQKRVAIQRKEVDSNKKKKL